MFHACPHPVGVSSKWSDHGNEEWLLQQSDHSADHGLEACQCAKVVGWVAAGEMRVVKTPNENTRTLRLMRSVLETNELLLSVHKSYMTTCSETIQEKSGH